MVTVTINIKPYLAGYMYVRYRQSLEPDPNLNFTEAMPETELMSETGVKSETGLIPETSFQEGVPIRHVLSNSFGFGGNDSSLLFSATNFPKRTNL